ncbi:hypothetical protein [Ammoniphilus sp. CFH 90114]|uniref:hypothetical protein n=1 Tax=Ammoniphilus sp. CFH 90114 TaxID=2493665 RepID=UPI00100F699D|nr:hypothetical protein [Ammoniphilus sp. CFH 90114]RXT06584.1 hypothetical protein EIZ39_16115 [Ammoniphilus sp. CFH 90114]
MVLNHYPTVLSSIHQFDEFYGMPINQTNCSRSYSLSEEKLMTISHVNEQVVNLSFCLSGTYTEVITMLERLLPREVILVNKNVDNKIEVFEYAMNESRYFIYIGHDNMVYSVVINCCE